MRTPSYWVLKVNPGIWPHRRIKYYCYQHAGKIWIDYQPSFFVCSLSTHHCFDTRFWFTRVMIICLFIAVEVILLVYIIPRVNDGVRSAHGFRFHFVYAVFQENRTAFSFFLPPVWYSWFWIQISEFFKKPDRKDIWPFLYPIKMTGPPKCHSWRSNHLPT